jgi:hypothetical protein
MQRPNQYNKIIQETDDVYASFTLVDDKWIRGLFCKTDIPAYKIIGFYEGKYLTPAEADVSSSEYLMTARQNRDRRKKVVLDGNPDIYNNICGFANYAVNSIANATFEDTKDKSRETSVILKSKQFIPAGCEIRVDYDLGQRSTPFLNSLIAKGLPRSYFVSPAYKQCIWTYPEFNDPS